MSDFGLARQLDDGAGEYYKSVKGSAVPVRWTSVEALEQRKYTEKRSVTLGRWGVGGAAAGG